MGHARQRVLRWDVFAAGLALLALDACDGASRPEAAPGAGTMPVANAPAKPAAVSFQLKFPAATLAGNSGGRFAQYVSPASSGLALYVYSALATQPATPTAVVDVSPTSSLCVAASGGGRTCTFGFNAPVGNDAFALTLYDKIAGGAIPTSANALSSAVAFANVASNQTNVVSFALGGIVKSVVIAPQSIALAPSAVATSIPITVVPRDADGFIIVDSAPFINPIALALSGDTGKVLGVPASPISSSAGTLVNVTYSGGPVSGPITLTASASGALSGATVFTSGTTPGVLPIGVPANPLAAFYVGNAAGVLRFPPNATASALPEVTLNEHNVNGIAFDAAGRVVIAERLASSDSPPRVVMYPPAPSAASTPVAIVSSSALCTLTGVAVDSFQNIYVSNNPGPGCPAVAVFRSPPAGTNTGVTPAWTLTDPALSDPRQIALDANDNLYVANGAGNSVAIYAPGARGNVGAVRTIAGSATGLSTVSGVAVDYAGNLYAFNAAQTPLVSVFPPNAAGNVAPVKTFSSPSTGLSVDAKLAADAYGNVLVTNFGNVLAFGPNASGNAAMPFAAVSQGVINATALASVPFGSVPPVPVPTSPPSLPPLLHKN